MGKQKQPEAVPRGGSVREIEPWVKSLRRGMDRGLTPDQAFDHSVARLKAVGAWTDESEQMLNAALVEVQK